MAALNRLDH